MARLEQLAYRTIYSRATSAEELPWHREDLPELLEKTLAISDGPLRILDVGCGAGTFTIEMARRGHDVTGLDFVPKALEFARSRARDAGLHIPFVEADALRWEPEAPFDLVFDSGCLHSLRGRDRRRYKRRLLGWLEEGSSLVLVHFAPLFPLDWRPVGPRRRRPAHLRKLLGPQLVEVERRTERSTAPFPVGPHVQLMSYHFRRH